METLLVLLLVVVLLGAAGWLIARVRPPAPRRKAPPPGSGETRTGDRVVLDLDVDDPAQPTVMRLAEGAAQRALRSSPELHTVEVFDRRGLRLMKLQRSVPQPRSVELPATLHEPRVRRSRAPDPLRSQRGDLTGSPRPARVDASSEQASVDLSVPARPFAKRFDLPPIVRARLMDPEHPAAVVTALLAAAGRPVDRHGDLLLSGEVAIALAAVDRGAAEALTRAYLQIRASGAPRGIVIRLGYVDPADVRRREMAAPDVRHASIDAIQRMADAVALGADPVSFAVVPGEADASRTR